MPLLKLGLCAAAAIVAIAVPPSFFESGPTVCLWKRVFGVGCLGCGMTRAVSCALHGDFARALDHNALVVAVLPLLCWCWCKYALRQLRRAVRALRGAAPAPCPEWRGIPTGLEPDRIGVHER